MSSFYGKKSGKAQGKRPRQVSRAAATGAANYESTPVPMRKAHQTPGKKRRVALHSIQPTARPDDEASQRFQLHYKPGMDLTTISNPFPTVDADNSSDSEKSFEDEELSGDYSLQFDRDERDFTNLPEDPQSSFSNSLPEKSLISMIQQQQAMLEQVLEGQKRLVERQDGFEHQLTELESKVKQPLPSTPSSSSSEGKRKRLVTRTLSNKVYTIHKELEEQFNPSELRSSDHNSSVQQRIIKEILDQADCKFSESIVKVAVKRCYENIRRTFNEQQSGKQEFTEQQSKRRKYRSRRQRKFERRSSVVKPEELAKFWHKLSLSYVTEESDDPDNPNGIIEHKLLWRSQKLDDFMGVLDTRLAKTQQRQLAVGMVAKKVRKEGTPSDSLPPPDAPSWAVKDHPQVAEEADKENEQP